MALQISRLGRYELIRFRGPLAKASLAFVLLVPLLYALIYLSGNWDPYGRIKDLPVAVVNHDQPVTYNGKPVAAGAELVDKLVAGRALDWHVTDSPDATSGLARGRYYLVLTIPEDFSANLVSGSGTNPQRARIEMRRDDANGYAVGNLTRAAQASIVAAVDQSAQASYFNAVFANLATIREGFSDASDGAQELATGLSDAHVGASRLDSGLAAAETGAAKLDTGTAALDKGLATADTGAGALAGGLKDLDAGSASLATGAKQVAAGTRTLRNATVPTLTRLEKDLPAVKSRVDKLVVRIDDVAGDIAGGSGSVDADLASALANLATLRKNHPELANDTAYNRILQRVQNAADTADQIAATTKSAATLADEVHDRVDDGRSFATKVASARKNIATLDNGAHDVSTGAAKMRTSIVAASKGATALAAGVRKAHNGSGDLAKGAATLHTGLAGLHTGASDLADGLVRADTGAGTLSAQLAEGTRRIPVVSADQQADAVQVLSAPAQVDSVVDHAAGVNGRGFAPLFFAVALWVFGISAFQVLRPISARILAGRAHPVRLALAAYAPIGTVAVAAGWLMVGSVWILLGLHPEHPILLIVAVTLGALAFSAIAHLLNVALGTVGSSLLLVLLLLQLCSSGGTYPGPLVPGFFDAIGPFLPLTYLISSYRVAISGGLPGIFVRDLSVLLGILVVVLGLLVLVVMRRARMKFSRLHPL